MEDYFKPLIDAEKIEVPQTLYDKVLLKIESELRERYSIRKASAIAACTAAFLLFNIYTVVQHMRPHPGNQSLAQSFNLMPNNDIYSSDLTR